MRGKVRLGLVSSVEEGAINAWEWPRSRLVIISAAADSVPAHRQAPDQVRSCRKPITPPRGRHQRENMGS